MNIKSITLATSALILSSSVNAALVERLGGLAYYDTEADLTWLADANAAGLKMTSWESANTVAAGLTVGGVGGWRLADTLQPDASCDLQDGGASRGFNCTGSEMGNLFYNVLGNTEGLLTNTGPFSNVKTDDGYWTATELELNTDFAWIFGMSDGRQGTGAKYQDGYAWFVQSGDVSAVPVPAAVWLFGSGLIGLIGVARRKKS